MLALRHGRRGSLGSVPALRVLLLWATSDYFFGTQVEPCTVLVLILLVPPETARYHR